MKTKEEVRKIIKENRFIKDRIKAVKDTEWFGTGYDNYRVGDIVKKYGRTYMQISANKGKYHYAYFVKVED